MIYMNYVTSALKKLRERSQAFLQEQRTKFDARVKKHSQQMKATPTSDKLSKDNSEKTHSNIKKEKKVLKVKDKITDKGKKQDWKEFEAELQNSFFTEEMKTFSKQFDEKTLSKKVSPKPPAVVSPSASKFYSKPSPISSSVKMPKPAANLEVDLFGESSSEDETTPIIPGVIMISDDSEPGVSFESALSKKSKSKIPKKSVKRRNSSSSRVEVVKKERKTSSTSSVEPRTMRVSRNRSRDGSSSKDAHVRRKSSVTLIKTPVLKLSRVLRVSSSDSGGRGSPEHKPPLSPVDNAVLKLSRVLRMSSSDSGGRGSPEETKHKPLPSPIVLTKHKPSLSPVDNAVFDEIQPEEQVCHTVTSLSQPLSPLFAPSGPYINLTKLATAKKPPPDIASIARAMGKRPVVPRKAMPTRAGSVTVVKKKEIPFTREKWC